MVLASTSALAGLFALLMTALSVQTSVRRVQVNVVFGDGEDNALRRRMRPHGNFIEYAPLCLAVVALLELTGPPAVLAGSAAAIFAASRVLHALGMLYFTNPPPRGLAMVSQHVTLTVTGVWLIAYALNA